MTAHKTSHPPVFYGRIFGACWGIIFSLLLMPPAQAPSFNAINASTICVWFLETAIFSSVVAFCYGWIVETANVTIGQWAFRRSIIGGVCIGLVASFYWAGQAVLTSKSVFLAAIFGALVGVLFGSIAVFSLRIAGIGALVGGAIYIAGSRLESLSVNLGNLIFFALVGAAAMVVLFFAQKRYRP